MRPHRRPPRPLLALLLLAAAAAAWWYLAGPTAPPPSGIVASGTIEAEEVAVASEITGRVVQTLAEEGDTVQAGEPLVRLDDELLRLQHRMAPIAERHLLELQLDRTEIRSPIDGKVARRAIRAGEIATPGSALMVVANLDRVDLTLFVPEALIGQVHTGQRVEVRVDSFPDEVFLGEVTFISSEAEFTPRNVQTRDDRMNLVFAVKVRIDNPDHRLKPGMPADATIIEVTSDE